MPNEQSEVRVRRAGEADLAGIIELATSALGWRAGEPNEVLFRWKHFDNPFGRSPMWVAEVDGRLAGFRTFLRWQFRRPDGSTVAAVRAVDTATHPDFQGRGLFTRLTTGALEEMRAEGVGFVFNTPNEQSRPGYLKMGWQVVGRPPIAVRPKSPAALVRMARARKPAGKWSLPSEVGEPASVALADPRLGALLASRRVHPGLTTDRTPEFMAWRYRLDELRYRVLCRTTDVRDGFVVFRLRARGAATEAVIADVITPEGAGRAAGALLAEVQRRTGADYLLKVERRRWPRHGFVRLPRQGPVLTWRAVNDQTMPQLDQFDLTLGDVELF